MITLPALPYEMNALEPIIDTKTVEIHYTKHHQGYVNKLNELISDTPFVDQNLETIITSSEWPIFNNAAQIRNHTFYREGLAPAQEKNLPTGVLLDALVATRGSYETFIETMTASALSNFGSWWTWLVKTPDNRLEIINTSNAWCPLTTPNIPLLTIDVREHAYYLMYQNRRIEYITNIWKCINWDKILERYTQ